MKQKFKKLSFVRVCKEMPPCMSHFESDFDAIVEGTYSQLYGGKNITDYSLYQIKDGEIVNTLAWYKEYQLALIDDNNRDKAEQMIERYNFKD